MSSFLKPVASRGFSLIELMVVVAVVAVLAATGVPAFAAWLADSRVRSMTEEIAAVLRTAKAEAIRENAVMSVTVPTASGSAVTVSVPKDGISFNGRGRPVGGNARIDVSQADCRADGGARLCMSVLVSAGGAIVACNPALSAPDLRACP